MMFGNYVVCLFLPFFIRILLFFYATKIRNRGCEGQQIKETSIFAYYVPTELFVHVSVTREEGFRSLEHSDSCRQA